MNLEQYFSKNKGVGVMATSNNDGVVDTAIYSKPHVQGENNVAFIMRNHLTHLNLQENGHANYLFIEDGPGYNGVRLFLTKIEESTDQELIASMKRRCLSKEEDKELGEKFLVTFKVNKLLTLIGGNEITID